MTTTTSIRIIVWIVFLVSIVSRVFLGVASYWEMREEWIAETLKNESIDSAAAAAVVKRQKGVESSSKPNFVDGTTTRNDANNERETKANSDSKVTEKTDIDSGDTEKKDTTENNSDNDNDENDNDDDDNDETDSYERKSRFELTPFGTTTGRRSFRPEFCRFFDFAVVGFAKSGTTSMRHWLSKAGLRMPSFELEMMYYDPVQASKHIQEVILRDPTNQYPVGYGAPHDINWPSVLDFYAWNCPSTKLVVLLRHPVLWFESAYNYNVIRGCRIHADKWSGVVNGTYAGPSALPRPRDCIRSWEELVSAESYREAATGGADFHKFLAVLGKMPPKSEYLGEGVQDFVRKNTSVVTNPIFLAETTELRTTTENSLAKDLAAYLGVPDEIFPPTIPASNTKDDVRSRRPWEDAPLPTEDDCNKGTRLTDKLIDVCSPEWTDVHQRLMVSARNASTWISHKFRHHSTVYHSDSFAAAIEHWTDDPCLERHQKSTNDNSFPPGGG